MALIEQLKAVCDRLAPFGWRQLLLDITDQELDIAAGTPAQLAKALRKAITTIHRNRPGFQDFSVDGKQGITPGSPARSLLYHALASPNVLSSNGVPLGAFPTLRELDLVENYVFGVKPPKLADVATKAGTNKLAVVVFATEYRPGKDTCSRAHADLAFARTGIGRVGTTPPLYDGAKRGFWPEVEAEPFAIRVCPARYVAYLAVRKKADPSRGIPMRQQSGDASRNFWVPVHKLFDGKECLDGLDIQVQFAATHLNEKIRRIHTVVLGESNVSTKPPFRFNDGIAELATDVDLGPGVLVPVPHPRLVEPARDANGKPLTFKVPKNNQSFFGAFEPGVNTDNFGEIRPAPAYIHARTEVKNGAEVDLNNDATRPDVRKTVADGQYNALHYVDFSGEGEISATVTGLTGSQVSATVQRAYSVVAAPDFFPAAGQRELSEWTDGMVPPSLRAKIWAVPPTPLSDVRLPANLQLPANKFDPKEVTVTALVPLFDNPASSPAAPRTPDVARHSSLPDDAAGVFAPGWDVAHDVLKKNSNTTAHLAAYGLGSPFPEDAKLCAALSTFWPTVAPDVSRTFEPNPTSRRGTVSPLTDEEIGQSGGLPWDGIPGPQIVTTNGQPFIDCDSFFHTDYVQTALDNRFSIRVTARISAAEYQQRVLSMAFAYEALPGSRNTWFVISFQSVTAGNAELQTAQTQAGAVLSGPVYRVDLCRIQPRTTSPSDFRRRLMPVLDRQFVFVTPTSTTLLRKPQNSALWSKTTINL